MEFGMSITELQRAAQPRLVWWRTRSGGGERSNRRNFDTRFQPLNTGDNELLALPLSEREYSNTKDSP